MVPERGGSMFPTFLRLRLLETGGRSGQFGRWNKVGVVRTGRPGALAHQRPLSNAHNRERLEWGGLPLLLNSPELTLRNKEETHTIQRKHTNAEATPRKCMKLCRIKAAWGAASCQHDHFTP